MIWIDASKEKPATGRKVIVCGHYKNGNRWRTTARWYPAGTMDASDWDDPPEEWWDENEDYCRCPKDGWWEDVIEAEGSWMLENVTHWMPMPEFPKG